MPEKWTATKKRWGVRLRCCGRALQNGGKFHTFYKEETA